MCKILPAAGPTVTGRSGGRAVTADADGRRPRYLAFDPVLPSRSYLVAQTEDDDRSTGRRGRSGGRNRGGDRGRDDGDDYPVETDLFPELSLAAGGRIEPGLYASSFDTVDCSYQLWRDDDWGEVRLIGQDRLPRGKA